MARLLIAGIAVRCAICTGLLCGLSSIVRADERVKRTESELTEIRERIREEEERLDTLRLRQDRLEQAVKKLDAEISRVEDDRKASAVLLDTVGKRREQLEEALRATELKIADQRTFLSERVVGIYKMQRRAGSVDYLVNARSAIDLLRRATYLTRITAYDSRRLAVLAELAGEFRAEQEDLNEVREERLGRVAELDLLEQKLEQKRVEQGELLVQLRQESVRRARSVRELEAAARRLERIVGRIMGSEPEPAETVPIEPTPTPGPTPEPTPTPTPVQPVPPEPRGPQLPAVAPYQGEGLGARRGTLPLPVKGSLVRKFGKQRHEEFTDILFVKGLEIAAPVGAQVKAVAPGKVVLSQVLPGYGNVIIVDHGKRYYTLYGRLAGSLKKVGEVVDAGDVIAVLGEPDRRGRNFYFELRIKGKPVNPERYFRDRLQQA
ncbi:MAG: peptidoglycan DD-metalloendopeptidase family protein [Bdellovibrionales bacterium]|nr:peptidoglycan DD-metalloendopeptidase family protein [Bdellovibrionales bacterium]